MANCMSIGTNTKSILAKMLSYWLFGIMEFDLSQWAYCELQNKAIANFCLCPRKFYENEYFNPVFLFYISVFYKQM